MALAPSRSWPAADGPRVRASAAGCELLLRELVGGGSSTCSIRAGSGRGAERARSRTPASSPSSAAPRSGRGGRPRLAWRSASRRLRHRRRPPPQAAPTRRTRRPREPPGPSSTRRQSARTVAPSAEAPVETMRQVSVAGVGSTFPFRSTARTWNSCVPSQGSVLVRLGRRARLPRAVHVLALEAGAASLDVNLNVALCFRRFGPDGPP